MTPKQAQKAVQDGAIIFITDEPDLWGIATCLSDDESTIYYRPRCSMFRSAIPIDKVSVDDREYIPGYGYAQRKTK
jgi:hypothetical protein